MCIVHSFFIGLFFLIECECFEIKHCVMVWFLYLFSNVKMPLMMTEQLIAYFNCTIDIMCSFVFSLL